MSDWQSKSDFEINKAVAETQQFTYVIGDGLYPSQSDEAVHVERKYFKYGNIEQCGVDYCNNPSDAWPIITGNKIDLSFAVESLGGIGQAQAYIEGDTDIFSEFTDNNKALRAAMIVYLEMSGVKQ